MVDLLCEPVATAFCTKAGGFWQARGVPRVEKGLHAARRMGGLEVAPIVFTYGRVGRADSRDFATPGLGEKVESADCTAPREAIGMFEVNPVTT
jgi:hypothetical protein